MCYAIPGKIERIEGKTVIVDYFGEKRKAYNELIDISPGDYIYAQGGFVINKVPEDEAQKTLAVWKEMFFELQKIDLKISRLHLYRKDADARLTGILDNASQGKALTRDELRYLLELRNAPQLELLFKTANFLRQKYHKNSCCVHGIIEISNYCRQGCLYCGISRHNLSVQRYRMSKEEILEASRQAIEVHGFKSLVLQSGEDPGYSVEELADIVREIKQRFPSLIFISFGEIGLGGLETLYQAGARGLLMRFETSNPEIYRTVHPGQELETRIAYLKKAHDLGYLILTGGLIGLPGQTHEDLLNDIFLAKELHAEMFSFGPFLPHPGTPFAAIKPPVEEEVLKVLALARLIDTTHAKILVTTALETLKSDARKQGLLAGANSVMLNVTPLKYRSLYSIYPQRAHESEEIGAQIEETIALLRSLGRAPTDLEVA